MRLIGLRKSWDQARVEFYGCPLRCGYCTHIRQPKEEYDMQRILEFVADPKIIEVYLGGAEPTLQKKELKELLERLKRIGKKVVLKTSGSDPDFLALSKGLVYKYVIEMKCPLDERECNSELTGLSLDRTGRYLESLARSLDILKGERVRIWIRVIPGYTTLERIEKIGKNVEGIAQEVLLYQFLSNPSNDAPFRGIADPGPSESEMVDLARRMVKFAPRVVIEGRGFRSEFVSAPPSEHLVR